MVDNRDQEISISIALCTYNGEQYIYEQLLSISNQTLRPKEVVICDDHSVDGTVAIIEKFIKEAPFEVRLYQNEVGLGVVKNFEQAISHCRGNYIALCDQDDVWLPHKIQGTCAALQQAEAELGVATPLLVHSDLCVVNSDCEIISPSFMNSQKFFHVDKDAIKTLVVQNFVTGCTVLMNRALVTIALPLPRNCIMHDWWLALVAATCGKLLYVNQATIYYRQHGTNVLGATALFSVKSFQRGLLDVASLNESIARSLYQTLLLRDRLGSRMSDKARVLINCHVDNLRCMGLAAAIKTKRLGITKQGWLRNIVFYYLLMRAEYKKQLPNCHLTKFLLADKGR